MLDDEVREYPITYPDDQFIVEKTEVFANLSDEASDTMKKLWTDMKTDEDKNTNRRLTPVFLAASIIFVIVIQLRRSIKARKDRTKHTGKDKIRDQGENYTMKATTRIAAVIASAICVFTIGAAGCGSDSTTESVENSSTTAAGSSSESAETVSEADKPVIEPVTIKENAKVSYLGPEGTYTEEATKLFFGEGCELSPQETVNDAIAELNAGNADYAVIPQENTIGGAVTDYIDALIAQEEVYITGEVVLPISQTLMGVKGAKLDDIKTVYSHAQGIAQSEKWRSENLPNAVTEEKESTAAAAGFVAKQGDKSYAAIAAPGAAELYGLDVLAQNVQISMENKTRFYVLSKVRAEGAHTNAVFTAKCMADKVDDLIVDIHDSGLELTAIHARPEGSCLGSYNYIIEVEDADGITDEQISSADDADGVRFLGCFDVTQK